MTLPELAILLSGLAALLSFAAAKSAYQINKRFLEFKLREEELNAEAARMLQDAIHEWRLRLPLNAVFHTSKARTVHETHINASGTRTSTRVVEGTLVEAMETGISFPIEGEPNQGLLNKLMESPLVRSAIYDIDSYRIRLNFNKETYQIEKP